MPPRTPAWQGRIAFGVAPGKAGADPDFVRCMISREDLGGEYYYRVFGCEDSDSDMDMSDDDVHTLSETLSCLLF